MTLDVLVEDVSGLAGVPTIEQFRAWLELAIEEDSDASVALRIVSAEEMQVLNRQFRGKDEPTNVLSFPAQIPEFVALELDSPPLGDIVICAAVVEQEAKAQGKPVEAHWAHLAIHGLLHLRGYDHQDQAGAMEMESLEIRLLASLGISNPYK